jgi:hypothetical protein
VSDGERRPGDPARTDSDFGPLGGLPDQVHFEHKRTERERAHEAQRVATTPGPGGIWLPVLGLVLLGVVVAAGIPLLTSPNPDASPTPAPSPALGWINDLGGQLECDGPVASIGGEVPNDGGVGLPGATPEDGLANFLGPNNPYASLPLEGYTLLHDVGHWASFGHVFDGQVKAIIVLTDLEEFQRDGTGWLVIGLRACDAAEFDPDVPLTFPVAFWTDASGDRVSTEVIQSFSGPGHCGWESVTFLHVDGQLYFRDPEAVMAEYTTSAFQLGAELPPTAVDTGYRRERWALWLDPGEDAYVVIGDTTERWPRSKDPMLGCM